SLVTNRRCAGMAITPMLRKKWVSLLWRASSVNQEGWTKQPGRRYPAGILKAEQPSGGAWQRKRAPLPACQSSRQKSWNGSGKINVDNLSARRAIHSMAQALGRKHVLAGTRTCFKLASGQSTTNRSSYQLTASGRGLAT